MSGYWRRGHEDLRPGPLAPLGSVIAAVLASTGHEVVELDLGADGVASLKFGKEPILEPGLDALLRTALMPVACNFIDQPAYLALCASVLVRFASSPEILRLGNALRVLYYKDSGYDHCA
jgi:hypothetical protein